MVSYCMCIVGIYTEYIYQTCYTYIWLYEWDCILIVRIYIYIYTFIFIQIHMVGMVEAIKDDPQVSIYIRTNI